MSPGKRSLLTIVSRYIALYENPLHKELGYQPIYLTGSCPFCLTGRFVVVMADERWFCYGCGYGGTGEDGRRKFLRMILAQTKTQHLHPDELTLENAGLE